MSTMEEKQEVRSMRRRHHSAKFKKKMIQACIQPGVLIAAVVVHLPVECEPAAPLGSGA